MLTSLLFIPYIVTLRSQYRSPTVITLSNCSSVTPVNTDNHLKSIMSLAALLRITGNSCDSNPTNTSIALLFNASSVLTLIQLCSVSRTTPC